MTIIDPISGRIVRALRRDWLVLQSDATTGDAVATGAAHAAGLLRTRRSETASWWSWPLRMIAIRVPLVSIDSVAKWLAVRLGCLFSPAAILCWSLVIVAAVLSIVAGWSRLEATLQWANQSPESLARLGGISLILFVGTKCLHELGHAVACRRLNVPVGDVGLFFFFGTPCPYCDVSQVWRVDSRASRAMVMLAGIYVELIVASIATIVWWLTREGMIHVLAFQTMLVCGISTIVFNANPLMRMDGYYVLSDIVGTPNLRRQASSAWRGLVISRLLGIKSARARLTASATLLSGYHVASTLYRLFVTVAIMTTIVMFFSHWKLWWVGLVILSLASSVIKFRLTGAIMAVIKGTGFYREAKLWRRTTLLVVCLGAVVAMLLMPVRREVVADGFVDLADAVNVYAPTAGWIAKVHHSLGDEVQAGVALVSLDDPDLQFQLVSWRTRSNAAKLESDFLKRRALRDSADEIAWKLDKANRELVDSQLQTLDDRQSRLELKSPRGGTVFPPLNRSPGETENRDARLTPLDERVGELLPSQTTWCRIGDANQRCVKLAVSSSQRQSLDIGDVVCAVFDDGYVRRVWLTVDEISQRQPDPGDDPEQVDYELICKLPASQRTGTIGLRVQVRICYDHEPVWQWLRRTVNEALGGQVNSSG